MILGKSMMILGKNSAIVSKIGKVYIFLLIGNVPGLLGIFSANWEKIWYRKPDPVLYRVKALSFFLEKFSFVSLTFNYNKFSLVMMICHDLQQAILVNIAQVFCCNLLLNSNSFCVKKKAIDHRKKNKVGRF